MDKEDMRRIRARKNRGDQKEAVKKKWMAWRRGDIKRVPKELGTPYEGVEDDT